MTATSSTLITHPVDFPSYQLSNPSPLLGPVLQLRVQPSSSFLLTSLGNLTCLGPSYCSLPRSWVGFCYLFFKTTPSRYFRDRGRRIMEFRAKLASAVCTEQS